jgi:LPS O-antigen subunit length determinant protein (WzzB/FepE family)
LYKNLLERKETSLIEATDFKELKKKVPGLIEEGFKKQFDADPARRFDFTGQNIIQRDMLIKFILKILENDRQLTPFKILALETDNKDGYEIPFSIEINGTTKQIGLKGKIDRLDELNGNIRVIDYKTGKDELRFAQVSDLFERDIKKPNKAAFQALYYSLLYANKHNTEQPVTPGLYSRSRLFSVPFNYRLETQLESKKYEPVSNYKSIQHDYESMMQQLLEELFDEKIPFTQTEETSRCSYCSYKGICKR